MDAQIEKDILVTRLKAAALNNRADSLLAMAEVVNEYRQLTGIQQKQIDALQATIKAYEEKSVEPASPTISSPAPAAT
jgi:hypothetical protein